MFSAPTRSTDQLSSDGDGAGRGLRAMVGAVVLVDAMFYGAIAPLLPYYAEHFDLTKAQAGLLTGAYGAGTLLASLPAGHVAGRFGVRAAVLLGLGLMVGASVGFALGRTTTVLDVARFAQGLGGALSWAGGMAWLAERSPLRQRGRLIGTTLAAGISGGLLGPLLGTLAVSTSPKLVFLLVAALGVVLLAWSSSESAPALPVKTTPENVYAAVRDRGIVSGMWLIGLSALLTGTLTVLAPLRLSEIGAPRVTVGAAFLLGAGFAACASPVIGRLSDRHGWRGVVMAGLGISTAWVLVLPIPRNAAILFALVVLALGSFGFSYPSAGAMLSARTHYRGLSQGYAFALFNFAWAGGQMVGNAGSGALAELTSDLVPYAVLAGLCVVTVGAIGRLDLARGDFRSGLRLAARCDAACTSPPDRS